MVLWQGACHVHERFSVEKILELKARDGEVRDFLAMEQHWQRLSHKPSKRSF